MLLRKQQATDIPTAVKEIIRVEYVEEKLVKDDSANMLLEQLVVSTLFDKRGVICAIVGLVVGLVIGALVAAMVLV